MHILQILKIVSIIHDYMRPTELRTHSINILQHFLNNIGNIIVLMRVPLSSINPTSFVTRRLEDSLISIKRC